MRTLAILLLLAIVTGARAAPAVDPDDAWLNDFEQPPSQVGGEQLEFLPQPDRRDVHHHLNRIRITPDSLDSGWIELDQCHLNLDRVSRAQILFRENGIRGLKVTEAVNIGDARVEGHRVLLRDIGAEARLCLSAQSRALHQEGSGFVLRNGPYMRRFLDGYYPMFVRLEVEWPTSRIELAALFPEEQPGLEVSTSPGTVHLESWFRGRLTTEVHFLPAD